MPALACILVTSVVVVLLWAAYSFIRYASEHSDEF